jgi:polyhydroxyalkanoic acid synthase PhaR subunit
MADETRKDSKPFDPMEPWRGMRDAYLDVWAKAMVDMVNTEAYSQATGQMLDTYLTVSGPFREAVEKAMLKTLEQLAMPTRADVISIAERMTNIEMRLDDLDAKIDTLLARGAQASKPAASVSAPAARALRKAAKKTGRSRTAKKGKK